MRDPASLRDSFSTLRSPAAAEAQPPVFDLRPKIRLSANAGIPLPEYPSDATSALAGLVVSVGIVLNLSEEAVPLPEGVDLCVFRLAPPSPFSPSWGNEATSSSFKKVVARKLATVMNSVDFPTRTAIFMNLCI
ncbi:LysR family transcriptional regulator [Babesia caballi]|uniref:LysR family transcriptional regulator n=1 Tax=Babesia caballi TaxID=5871 RepID=A0AAV4LYI9_BABCB|nr:LysR family transcriptional regulator [Babesia caballi]